MKPSLGLITALLGNPFELLKEQANFITAERENVNPLAGMRTSPIEPRFVLSEKAKYRRELKKKGNHK